MLSKNFLILAYICLMFLSAIFFLYLSKKRHKIPLYYYFIHFFIVLWSGLMYLNIYFKSPIASYAYYADWIFTTPLIILALALTAMSKQDIKIELIALAMGLQAATILLGLLAQLQTGVAKYFFFFMGCLTMLGMFYIFLKPINDMAKKYDHVFHRYKILLNFVLVFWVAYPVIWLLGTPGTSYFSEYLTTTFFVILPFFCKSIFGFLDLFLLNQIYNNSIAYSKKKRT
jgi:bacteriorhodopsin